MNEAVKTHQPLLVRRQNAKSIVVMSLDNFKSYEETAFLMASPKNAKRLNISISELEQFKQQF